MSVRRLVLAALLIVPFAGFCCDSNCDYASMTTDRVITFCKDKGGVRSVQWNESTAICNDGTLQAFEEGYYHPEDGAPTP